MENDDSEQNEPLSRFTTLPERISVRLHKQLMPGETIEFTLRSVVGSHTEGGFGGVKPGFSFGSARSGHVQNDQMGHPWLISSVKSSIRGWGRFCVPVRHNTGKGVF